MNVPDLWQGDITIYSDFHNSIAPLIFLEIMVVIKIECLDLFSEVFI